MDHCCPGSYYPTKDGATNFVLCNTTAMSPFSTTVDPRQKAGKRKTHGLSHLSRQMWAAGCPSMLIFNFEYFEKAPASSIPLLTGLEDEVEISVTSDQVRALECHKQSHHQEHHPSNQLSSDFGLLQGMLLSLDLIPQDVGGEGDCLFRALAAQIGDAEKHMAVRKEVVRYMRNVRSACFFLHFLLISSSSILASSEQVHVPS